MKHYQRKYCQALKVKDSGAVLKTIFTFVTLSFFSDFKRLTFLKLCTTVHAKYQQFWLSLFVFYSFKVLHLRMHIAYCYQTSPYWSQLLIEQMSTEEHLYFVQQVFFFCFYFELYEALVCYTCKMTGTDHCCSCRIHSRPSFYWGILQYNTYRKWLFSLSANNLIFLHFSCVLMKSSDYSDQRLWLWTVYVWHDLEQGSECKFILLVTEDTWFNFMKEVHFFFFLSFLPTNPP